MLRLRAAPPPWCPANPKRWVVIDLEYFPLSGASSRTEGDTLAYLWETLPQRQPRVGITRDDIGTVVRTVGKRGKRREEILWPREFAWAYMTPSWSHVLWDVKEMLMPLKCTELFNKDGTCSKGDQSSACWMQNNCHCFP